jgi:uncharacterized damage-inducible protein DinB
MDVAFARRMVEWEAGVDTNVSERNRASRERLRAVVARLSDEDLQRELPGGWTVADALGHLAFYDHRAALLLDRFAQEGVFPSPLDVETVNAVVLRFTRRIPLQDLAAEALAAAEAADGAVEAAPAALLAEVARSTEVKLDRAGHRASHLADIEAALAQD